MVVFTLKAGIDSPTQFLEGRPLEGIFLLTLVSLPAPPAKRGLLLEALFTFILHTHAHTHTHPTHDNLGLARCLGEER